MSIGFTTSGQLFVQFQATGSVGEGLFGGIGLQAGVSHTDCDTPSGISTDKVNQVDANFGYGPSIGGSVQYNPNGAGVQTGVGRIGFAWGAQFSYGVTQTVTIATPPLFGGH